MFLNRVPDGEIFSNIFDSIYVFGGERGYGITKNTVSAQEVFIPKATVQEEYFGQIVCLVRHVNIDGKRPFV